MLQSDESHSEPQKATVSPIESPIETISTALSFSVSEYNDKFNDPSIDVNALIAGALDIIKKHEEVLKTADDRCSFNALLTGLLLEAPTVEGQKHVALVLNLADRYGEEGVIKVATAWLEHMIFPLLRRHHSDPNDSDESDDEMNPEPDDDVPEDGVDTSVTDDNVSEQDDSMAEVDDSGYSSEQAQDTDSESHDPRLKPETDPDPISKAQVARREERRCAITKAWDHGYLRKMFIEHRMDELPPGVLAEPQDITKATHIIPWIRDDTPNINKEDVVLAWNLLRTWAGPAIDVPYFAGQEIHSPTNRIYMSTTMEIEFGSFCAYFDKDAYPNTPNKYKVRHIWPGMTLSNGHWTEDVEFRVQDDVEPPNPVYLKLHAHLCKMLYSHGWSFNRPEVADRASSEESEYWKRGY